MAAALLSHDGQDGQEVLVPKDYDLPASSRVFCIHTILKDALDKVQHWDPSAQFRLQSRINC